MEITQAEEVRFGTARRWKGKRLLTKTEKLERQRAHARTWRAKNRERLRDYFRRYREAHPELKQAAMTYYREHLSKWKERPREDLARRRVRNAGNKEHNRLVHLAWREKNREHVRQAERRRRDRRREQKRLADREYRRCNPERCKAGIARAKAAKPELYRAIQVNSSNARRARKKALTIERVSPKRLYARDESRCHLCHAIVKRHDRSLDHLIPIVRNGPHAEWNLATAHLSCNKRRGTRRILPEETREAAEAYLATRIAARVEAAA